MAIPIQNDRREVWEIVFNVISSIEYQNARDLIRLLEAAREIDGYGPDTTVTEEP